MGSSITLLNKEAKGEVKAMINMFEGRTKKKAWGYF